MDYKKQAWDFLAKTKTILSVVVSPVQKTPLWAKPNEKHGINYTCTLENKNAKYVFDYWGSISDLEIIEAINSIQQMSFRQNQEHYQAERLLKSKDIKWQSVRSKEQKEKAIKEYTPTAYDILACLSPLYEDDFKDFCSSFGYDEDSITALKVFEACKEQDRNLRKLFDRSELEQLSEIQ